MGSGGTGDWGGAESGAERKGKGGEVKARREGGSMGRGTNLRKRVKG